MAVIHGADGPQLLNTIRRLLKVEVAALKGRGERQVVSIPLSLSTPLESLDLYCCAFYFQILHRGFYRIQQ